MQGLDQRMPTSSKSPSTSASDRSSMILRRAIPRIVPFTNGVARQTGRHARPQCVGPVQAVASQAEVISSEPVSGAQNTASASQKPEQKKRVLSGVQPTGKLHLGNYMGAIKNWVPLQDTYDAFFFIVDMHAITVPHDPVELRTATRTMAATYMAAGIDPAKCNIFVQSHVPGHAELQWLLNCVTPIGWLNRMIQFKEKSRKQGEDVRAGLLTYPVLMAADILLFQADLVPVGEDQKQHLELTRDIAQRVNDMFGGKQWKKRGGRGGRVFKVPEPFIPPAGARIMSLQDGTSKMSKSAENDLSRINLTDPADVIANKIKKCKTDTFEGLIFDDPNRPECNNLLTLYQLASGRTKSEIAAEVASMRWGEFKPKLADAMVEHLRPIQERYQALMTDVSYVDSVLAKGADAANIAAEQTLINCKDAMGFVLPPRYKKSS